MSCISPVNSEVLVCADEPQIPPSERPAAPQISRKQLRDQPARTEQCRSPLLKSDTPSNGDFKSSATSTDEQINLLTVFRDDDTEGHQR